MVHDANENSIKSWNENAATWSELMKEGSPFQLEVVDPILYKILPPIISQMVLVEIGCGNGFLSRRFAKHSAKVYAFDSSEKAISLAKELTPSHLRDYLFFEVLDVTQNNLSFRVKEKIDMVVCNMSFMDIADIAPIFSEAKKILKKEGMFILTQTHPCFEKSVGPLFHEVLEKEGIVAHIYGVKVINYLTSSCTKVKAMPQLPKEHLFFHRSLTEMFHYAFENGFVVDKFEEGAYSQKEKEHTGWHNLTEIPVIVGIRFRNIS